MLKSVSPFLTVYKSGRASPGFAAGLDTVGAGRFPGVRSTTGAPRRAVHPATSASTTQATPSLTSGEDMGSADAGQKWNKHHGIHTPLDKPFLGAFDHVKMLLAALLERKNHSTTRAKLLEQRLRRAGCCRGHDNGVEGRDLGHAGVPVAMTQVHVGDARLAQVLADLAHERRDAFDRVNLLRQLRQHRSLVTAAGANFQDPGQRPAVARELRHARHGVRARDGLAKTER